MFGIKKKSDYHGIKITPKGYAYFTKKHIIDQFEELGMIETKQEALLFEPEQITDIVMIAQRKDMIPVVTFLPWENAHKVFEGVSMLISVDVHEDICNDGGDDACEDAENG